MGLGILALFLANFLGGGLTPVFIKIGVAEIPPLTFTALRFILATLIFLPVYLQHSGIKISQKNFKWVLLNSIFFTINVGLFSIGIQYTNVVISQILYTLVPVIVAFLAHFLLKEKITVNKAIGSSIAFLGVIFLISQSFNQQNIFGKPLGNLIILTAVFSWSAYYAISRKISSAYSQISISFANFLTSAILLSFLIPFELMIRPFNLFDVKPTGLTSLLVVSFASSVIFINLLQIGIKKCGAFIASLFSYFGPFSAALIAVPFLEKKLP